MINDVLVSCLFPKMSVSFQSPRMKGSIQKHNCCKDGRRILECEESWQWNFTFGH